LVNQASLLHLGPVTSPVHHCHWSLLTHTGTTQVRLLLLFIIKGITFCRHSQSDVTADWRVTVCSLVQTGQKAKRQKREIKAKCAEAMMKLYNYTVSQKKGGTILSSISLLNIDRFSQFFHRRTQ